jgi:hypothetical protein
VGYIALRFLLRAMRLAMIAAALAGVATPVLAQAPRAAPAATRAEAPVRLTPTVPTWWGSGLPEGDSRIARDNLRSNLTWWVGSVAEDGILRDIATQPWNANWGSETYYGFSWSYRLGRFWRDFAVDFELGGAFRSGNTNSPEAWYAFYFRYDGFPWRDRLYTSFGLSTGIDYLARLPVSETGTAAQPEPNQSYFLHYFSPELVFGLPEYPQHEVAIRYVHRSGFFGGFNGVYEGSNVLAIGYRRRF